MLMSRLSTDGRTTECEDRARILEQNSQKPPPDKSCTNPRVLSHSCWIFSWGWQLRRMLNTADKGRSLETPQILSTEQPQVHDVSIWRRGV